MSITTGAARAYIKAHYPATPMAALARACGVTRQRVLQIVKDEGLFVRRGRTTWPSCDPAGATMTIPEAAALLGIAPSSVARTAARNNGGLQRVPGDPTRLLVESVTYYAEHRMVLHRGLDTPSRAGYTHA
jgi:hypothetical protein